MEMGCGMNHRKEKDYRLADSFIENNYEAGISIIVPYSYSGSKNA